MIYLDNNATTRVLTPIREAMLPWLGEHYGNASSSHAIGQVAKQALVKARTSVAKLINAHPVEVIFTSGATESNHTAIFSALAAQPQKKRIVTSTVEHSSTLLLLKHLQTVGVEVVYVPVLPTGALDMSALREAVNQETVLVTLMHANNETGVVFPVAEVAEITQQQGALLHVDAAQTAGKFAINTKEIGCDLLSFSGHKLHAPQGVGVLFVKKGLAITPRFFGHQERHRRGGTENLPGIVGLSTACALAEAGLTEKQEAMSALRDYFEQHILAKVPFAYVNGTEARVCNTSNICFSGLNGEALLNQLEKNGIIASLGSACTAGGTDPSHVLLAMGLRHEDALASIRFSLSCETTRAEIETAIGVILRAVEDMLLQSAA